MLRSHRLLAVVALAALLAPSSIASALSPSAHRDLACDACRDATLPRSFCDAVASAAYSTDAREWEDMAAHAQIPEGTSPCDAATASAERERRLGDQIRVGLDQLASTASSEAAAQVATDVGRALHTVQDECAHHGMPNSEHAWLSRSDLCDGTSASPDLQPGAMGCARDATRRVIGLLRAALDARGASVGVLDALSCRSPIASPDDRGPDPCTDQVLPGPGQVCDFVVEAHGWDGVDRRWDGAVVGPALEDAFARGLVGDLGSSVRVCELDEVMLPPERAAPVIDVTAGPASCVRMELLCLGKTDDASSFFGDEAEASGEAAATDASAGSGCSASPNGRAAGRSGLSTLGLVLGLSSAALRAGRRRRRRS
ncbi:MAG: hypothetical protein IT379_26360 [Deltaproteobacteria bacterium]|nr:hypothetical protein [Deltaproteobacteria bacterium]